MDILRQSLAPITDEAWDEINKQSKNVFNSVLSARRFVDIEGPKGWDFEAVSLGRLEVGSEKKGSVRYGINKVLPLIESRVSFELDMWELDNAVRGAVDLNLEPMEEAARKIAGFEENVIYNGFNKSGVKGLKTSGVHKPVKYPDNVEELPKVIAEMISQFVKSSVEGPYSLVLSTEKWEALSSHISGYPLKKVVKDLLEGKIILNPSSKDSFLVSERGGDFSLTLGQDLSIGYESHDTKNVQLYFTESFTFRVIDPASVINFN
jgi:uncharacterized linocin/CFP29 family protein